MFQWLKGKVSKSNFLGQKEHLTSYWGSVSLCNFNCEKGDIFRKRNII